METLNGIRGDEQVDLFWTKVTSKSGAVDVGEPALPRRRKAPNRFDDIYAVRRRLPGNNFDKEQIRVQLQLLDANYRYSGRTSPVHSRHSCKECYIGEIVHCATTSQKLLAHHDATGTSELSDVDARSQGMNICSVHASSVNIIHWPVGASVRHLCSV